MAIFIIIFLIWLLIQFDNARSLSSSTEEDYSDCKTDPSPESAPEKTYQSLQRDSHKKQHNKRQNQYKDRAKLDRITDDPQIKGYQPTYLYYVELSLKSKKYYKVGISSHQQILVDFAKEMEHGLSVKVLQTWHYASKAQALKNEVYILDLFKDQLISEKNGPLLYGGNSEVFSTDILNYSEDSPPALSSKIAQAILYLNHPHATKYH